MKPHAVMVDLDGTIASSSWREVLIGPDGVENWPRFHEHLTLDSPIPEVVTEVDAHRQAGDRIIVITARGGTWRRQTEWWLMEHGIAWDELLMRTRDGRAAAEKLRLYREHVEPFYEVVECFEDHPGVNQVWTDLGLNVRVCDDPDLPPVIEGHEFYLAEVLAAGDNWRAVSVPVAASHVI